MPSADEQAASLRKAGQTESPRFSERAVSPDRVDRRDCHVRALDTVVDGRNPALLLACLRRSKPGFRMPFVDFCHHSIFPVRFPFA